MSDDVLYLHYVGVATLLGSLVRPRDCGDAPALEMAFTNVNTEMAARGSLQEFRVCHDGSYAPFERRKA